MTLDMYSEKVAETSALIREFAKVDYFHYFARDPESSLEAFIAMQDSAHAAGRASALAELHPQWLAEKERADRAEKNFAELSNASVALNNQHVAEQERQAERIAGLEAALLESRANDRAAMTHLAEAKSRIADLERQLAEASAPAVEQPIGHISKGMLEQLRERLGVSGYVQSGRTEEFPVAIYAAPQAADTDIPEALELLAAVFDAWENGDDCYEDPHAAAGYLGKAFRLDDDVFKRCCELLNRRNPPRNAPLPAADTDKVREAIPDGCALSWNGTIYHGISEIYHQMEEGAALHMVLDEKSVPRADKDGCVYSLVGRVEQYVAAFMAAQAPVREVPGYRLVPIEPTPEMFRVGCEVHDQRPSEVREVYSAMLAAAPLPAVPVQQEGE